jgi:hypothetical protein
VKRFACVSVLAALVLASPLLGAAKPVAVTASGGVGPLHMDASTRADVIAFAGKPEGESFGQYDRFYGRYDALGYGCPGRSATDKFGFPRCDVVFYVHVRSGKLEELYTADPRYLGPHGIHAGMANVRAAHLLHRRLPALGCQPQFFVKTATGVLAVVLGDRRVVFMVLVAHKHAAGVFDCIDS